MQRYTFEFKGFATKADKPRGIAIGDEDIHVLLGTDEQDAVQRCTLEMPMLVASHLCNKDWDC